MVRHGHAIKSLKSIFIRRNNRVKTGVQYRLFGRDLLSQGLGQQRGSIR